MSTNRIISIGLALALAAVFGLTAAQAFATAEVVANTATAVPASARAENPACPFTDLERMSLRSEYFEGVGWMLVSDNGPVGYDGGMLVLLDC